MRTVSAPDDTVTHGAVRGADPVKGILGGTAESGRHIGCLTKYLTKDVARAAA